MDGEPVRKMAGLADSLDGKSRALTVADIAQLLNISERQVYKLAAEHRIPCFKIGGCIRFDPLAVDVWLRPEMARAPGEVNARRHRQARNERGGARREYPVMPRKRLDASALARNDPGLLTKSDPRRDDQIGKSTRLNS